MPGAIFVSYRRATTSNAAGRLADRLMDHFGEDQVFVDVDAIEPGVDFVEVIENAVAACRVLLVVIGPTWHSVTDADGRRRLDDPHDPVVIEVRAGLANPAIRVIPVLVEGAQMPRVDDLPAELRRLARINAARLEHASFRNDAKRLMDVLERVFAAPPPPPPAARPAAPSPAPASAEERIPDYYPPPTTSLEIQEARRLAGPGNDERGAREAYWRAIDSGHADVPIAWAELGLMGVLGEEDVLLRSLEEAFDNAVASGHPTAEPMGHFGRGLLAKFLDDAAAERHLEHVAFGPYRALAMRAAEELVGIRRRRGDSDGAQRARERLAELTRGRRPR